MSGLTVQDGKFVTVRGMSDRYNNVLFNGASLPSTEPNKRNFSFDIIPSSLIDNVVVNKTFTPDLPAEFSGGLVQVTTIDVPIEPILSISVGSGFNTISTGENFTHTKRFDNDYWGGGKDRTWFNTLWNQAEFNKHNVITPAEADHIAMNAQNQKIPNLWGVYRSKSAPMQSYQLSAGNTFRLKNEHSIGVVVAGNYRHEEPIASFKGRYRAYGDRTDNRMDNEFSTALGALGNITWQHKDHKISWRNFYNKRFSHNTMTQDVTNLDGSGDVMFNEYFSRVLMNRLVQTRLEGEHLLTKKGLKLGWFVDHNQLKREQPDDRFAKRYYYTNEQDAATGKRFFYYDLGTPFAASGNYIFAGNLKERKNNLGFNLEKPFSALGRQHKLKVGYMGVFRNARYNEIALKPMQMDKLSNEFFGQPDYEIFAPENFANNKLYNRMVYVFGSKAGTSYHGNQDIHAGYLMADLIPLNRLRLIGGVRYENDIMTVSTVTRRDIDAIFVDSTITYKDPLWLPAASAIYSITPKMNVRAAYSKTLARPDFKERSSFFYYDPMDRNDLKSNGGIKQSYTHNYDLRLEWYPEVGEVISVSVFYKKFIKPVETVAYPQQGGGLGLMYFNVEDALTKGLEIDFRKSLGFFNKGSGFLNNLFISGNGTIMEGNVNYDPQRLIMESQGLRPDQIDPTQLGQSQRKRPLQGLSSYIINAGILYQGDIIGLNITYNRFGRRISVASVRDDRDEYEAPRDVLDAQLSVRIMKKRSLELKLNAGDVLAQPFIIYRTTGTNGFKAYNKNKDDRMHEVKRGSNYSASITYRF